MFYNTITFPKPRPNSKGSILAGSLFPNGVTKNPVCDARTDKLLGFKFQILRTPADASSSKNTTPQ